MKTPNANHLFPGSMITVRFGARGSQVAYVTKRTRMGNLHGCKWRERSKSWTKPARIFFGEITGFASSRLTEEQARKLHERLAAPDCRCSACKARRAS